MVYSINQRSDQADEFLAAEVSKLVDQTVKAKSITGQISTAVRTTRPAVDFPLLTAPVDAGFIDELDDLPLSNVETDAVRATIFKVAGASQASSEMLSDMSPEVASQIGATIADSIIWSIDKATLGNTTVNGWNGLLSLAATAQDSGASIASLDAFVKSVYQAQNAVVPAKINKFVVSPAVAEQLSLLKDSAGSLRSLLSFQEDGSILVAGVPILISSLVDANTKAWGVDSTHNRFVQREATKITKTYVPQNDSWFISGVARYGWVNLAPESVIRIFDAP